MKGVAVPSNHSLIAPLELEENTNSVLIGCNSLMNVGGKIMGDPIELAVFKALGGTIQNNVIMSKQGTRIHPIRRYAFDSTLKRMSVLVTISSRNTPSANFNRVLSKGAPETMKSLFKSVPENYDACFNTYAKQGYRVLALGYNSSNSFNITTKREEVEKDLEFCGFVVVETPLKDDTVKYITELKESEYDICIITGDHQLTTAKVSQDLKLGPKNIAFIKIVNKNSSNPLDETGLYNNSLEKEELHKFYEKLEKTLDVCWVDSENNIVSKENDVEGIKKLSKKYTLGITGKELEIIIDTNLIQNKHEIFRFIKLYCRVSPLQKDDIVKMLIKAGLNPSMCGDGSNDVGALKRAVIGVALLNSEEKDKNKNKQPFNIFSLEDDTSIKGGDVTAAAPFTAKSGSIKCIKNIFIQGRCTLVITFQMYKILALNCLLTAYSLSVLALKGIKFSDYQSTYMGFVVAFFFLMLSKAEPLKTLNKNKPPYSIFTVQSIISIVGQSVTHLICLTLIMNLTEYYDPININKVKSLDDPFAPSLINTVIFIFSAINQTINFAVNYQGEPFMKNMSENIWLKRLIFFIVGITLIVVFDLSMELNEALELVPLPSDMNYKIYFVVLLAADFVICFIFENWKKLLGKYVK
jgi:cation-transporting ATPase 13A1